MAQILNTPDTEDYTYGLVSFLCKTFDNFLYRDIKGSLFTFTLAVVSVAPLQAQEGVDMPHSIDYLDH